MLDASGKLLEKEMQILSAQHLMALEIFPLPQEEYLIEKEMQILSSQHLMALELSSAPQKYTNPLPKEASLDFVEPT